MCEYGRKIIKIPGFIKKILRPILKKYHYIKKEFLFLKRFVSVYGLKRFFIRPTIGNPIKQKIITYEIGKNINYLEEFKDYMNSEKISFNEGRFAIYLAPPAKHQMFPELTKYYPPQTGIKIIKKAGEPGQIKYANRELLPDASRVALHHLPSPADQISLINYMSGLKFFPYCYDVIRVKMSEKYIATAYILEHIDGQLPSVEDCNKFIKKLKNELDRKVIGLTLPNWESNMDFQCPDANSNLFQDKKSAELKYVDFQNFLFVSRKNLLNEKIKEAKKDTHFGESKLIMGGNHLYQSIPGISRTFKRNTDERFSKFVAMLRENEILMEGKLVLDIGCNIGMILAKGLAEGAWWGVGFDKPEIIKHTRKILSLLGFSRVDLYGVMLDEKTILNKYIPEWIETSKIKNSLIFYLAVHKHIGFISDLYSMPWKALIYEGHQNETLEETSKHLEDFSSKAKANVKVCQMYKDATTTPRPIALLIR